MPEVHLNGSSHTLRGVEQRTMRRQFYADCSCGATTPPAGSALAAKLAHDRHVYEVAT